MKRFALLVSALLLTCSYSNAQNMLERLGNRAKNAFEQSLGNKVEQAVYDAMDGKTSEERPEKEEKAPRERQERNRQEETVAQGWTCEQCGAEGNTGKFCAECGAKKPEAKAANAAWTCEQCGAEGNTGKFCNECGAPKPGASQANAGQSGKQGAAVQAKEETKKVAMTYAKSDFVPGDELIFEDTLEGEQLGEFPSRWDLVDGNIETVMVGNDNAVGLLTNNAIARPLMKNIADYLPDVYTIECDLYIDPEKNPVNYPEGWLGEYEIMVVDPNGGSYIEAYIDSCYDWDQTGSGTSKPRIHVWAGENSGWKYSEATVKVTPGWNHFALSVNKRAVKAYINGVRICNVPNYVGGGTQLYLSVTGMSNEQYSVVQYKNVRIAKGAVPLYDRLTTDGKIITYAITFETGKADLKPESMVEITRIAKLMQQNPNICFEVQGHCDATGSDKVNDPLSQKRAEAIVAALVEQGIAAARLSAVGKGSHNPIADNSSEEGRAKNRRVEFVKK